MIDQLWATNILVENISAELCATDLARMHEIGREYEAKHPGAHVPARMRNTPEVSYNLLCDERTPFPAFRELLKHKLKSFTAAEGFLEAVEFEGVCNLRCFGQGEFAKPHNHRSVDYVAVLFLDLDVTDDGSDRHQRIAGNRLFLIDPMPMRSRHLNHNMLKQVKPLPGLLIIHPASVFHTTEPNLGTRDLTALVINIRAVDPVRNYRVI